MSRLLSIDPGLRACGCALWCDGVLERAALVKGKQKRGSEKLAEVVAAMNDAVCKWFDPMLGVILKSDAVVCEYPQTYSGRAERGDANDLIRIALVVGSLVGNYDGVTNMTLVLPHEWKGSAPKLNDAGENLIEMRCRAGALSPEELARVEAPRGKRAATNVFDAIGIGLFYLKR